MLLAPINLAGLLVDIGSHLMLGLVAIFPTQFLKLIPPIINIKWTYLY